MGNIETNLASSSARPSAVQALVLLLLAPPDSSRQTPALSDGNATWLTGLDAMMQVDVAAYGLKCAGDLRWIGRRLQRPKGLSHT
eukprot:CAMPEP_0204191130 /NCGR_PEP_ID=MMETSP0361-20130328/59855_1 /ASSEMBLY_ACC=CAM_ASM_000343 /TAXON_ID=268821 /ORGANISM="Scrippsiella Hangoei, Strain SHTV-5" /LENGTH=84 /DNA_ID=CAMNT_0051152043 /DNA_START=190 /DNA_END=441 /DNA_ORIENTATION=+